MRLIVLPLLLLLVVVVLAVSYPGEPQPDRALAELKIYRDGSPLRIPVENWEGARRRATTDRAWRDFIDGRRRVIDEWMAERRDRVEWVAGWYHDFVSPNDGSFLVWTPDEPGELTLRSRSDPRVQLTPKLHGGWVYGFRTRHADNLQQAAALYRVTGDRKYAEWVGRQLDFYAENYERWPLEMDKGKSRLMYQSLDEAVLIIRLVNAARTLGDFVSPERKQAWVNRLFKPTAALLEEGQQNVHNIACWHRSATGQIALYSEDQRLWNMALDGPYGIRRQLSEGVTPDFLWFEQSLSYNAYVVQALVPFFTSAALAGRTNEVYREMAIVQNLMLSPIVLRFPTGQLPTPADTTGWPRKAPDLDLLASAYRIFPTPLGLSQAAGKRNWDTLLDPPLPPAHIPPLPPVVSRSLEGSRMAVLKQGPWQVFFHYGQLHQSHAQQEALNFEAFYESTDITHDPGTVGYGSRLHREFFRTGLAHNVPLANGQAQSKWHPGRLLRFEAGAAEVAAVQPEYQPGVTAARELKIDGTRLIDVVTLKSDRHRLLGLVLNLQGRVELPVSFVDVPDFAKSGRPAAFSHLSGIKRARFEDTVSFRVHYPERIMQVTLRLEGPFSVVHASAPDAPPNRRDLLYFETDGTQALFHTIIEPAPARSVSD
jgi:oligo-alginate lyase